MQIRIIHLSKVQISTMSVVLRFLHRVLMTTRCRNQTRKNVDVCATVHHVWIDKRYQLDATIMIYYQKLSLLVSSIYMPIFRSTGCMLLHMVFSTRCCGCGSKGPVRGLVHCGTTYWKRIDLKASKPTYVSYFLPAYSRRGFIVDSA